MSSSTTKPTVTTTEPQSLISFNSNDSNNLEMILVFRKYIGPVWFSHIAEFFQRKFGERWNGLKVKQKYLEMKEEYELKKDKTPESNPFYNWVVKFESDTAWREQCEKQIEKLQVILLKTMDDTISDQSSIPDDIDLEREDGGLSEIEHQKYSARVRAKYRPRPNVGDKTIQSGEPSIQMMGGAGMSSAQFIEYRTNLAKGVDPKGKGK
ncbi:MAG: hypothetical protein Q9170_002040 [Blastenia crenularia]